MSPNRRRLIVGDAWVFPFQFMQPAVAGSLAGATPVNLTGSTVTGRILVGVGQPPVYEATPTEDADTDFAQGLFKFIIPPNTLTLPLVPTGPNAVVTRTDDTVVARLQVVQVDSLGNPYTLGTEWFEVALP